MSIILLDNSGPRNSASSLEYLQEKPTERSWANNPPSTDVTQHPAERQTHTPNDSFRDIALNNRADAETLNITHQNQKIPDDDDFEDEWFWESLRSYKKEENHNRSNPDSMFRHGSFVLQKILKRVRQVHLQMNSLVEAARDSFFQLGPYRFWVLVIGLLALARVISELVVLGSLPLLAQVIIPKPCDVAAAEAYATAATVLANQDYSWLGNQWVPPPGVPFYTLHDMRKLVQAENILFIGDSTTRRACATMFAMLNATSTYEGSANTTITDLPIKMIDDTRIINVNMPNYGGKHWAQKPKTCKPRIQAAGSHRHLKESDRGVDDDEYKDGDSADGDKLSTEEEVSAEEKTSAKTNENYASEAASHTDNDYGDGSSVDELFQPPPEEHVADVPAPTTAPTIQSRTSSPTLEIPPLARMSGPLYTRQDYCRDLPVYDPSPHRSGVNHIRKPTPAPTTTPTKTFDYVSVDCYIELRSLLEQHGSAIRERYSTVVVGIGIHEFVNPRCAEAHDSQIGVNAASTPEGRLEHTLTALAQHLLLGNSEENQDNVVDGDLSSQTFTSSPKVFWRTHGYSSSSEHHEKHADNMIRLNQYARDWLARQEQSSNHGKTANISSSSHSPRSKKKDWEPPHQLTHIPHPVEAKVQLLDWGGAVLPRSGPGLHIEGDGMHAHYGLEARTLLAQMLTQQLTLDAQTQIEPPTCGEKGR